jgi:hypothetical protein
MTTLFEKRRTLQKCWHHPPLTSTSSDQSKLKVNNEATFKTRLRYSWDLSCDGGKVKYSGTSDKIIGGAYAGDWMEAQFGGFEAKHWERCQLKINFVDASPLLSSTKPKLNIYTELF